LQNDIRVGDLAARYGGEEFIIIFYNTDAETARIRATNIKDAVSLLQVKYGAQQVGHITISIGISEYPKNGLTPAELIEAADKALYFAKNNGRNKIILFSEIN
jgi:diguanylate cyclase (GGDEF)-like protein